jgi:hypothetical protein
MSQARFQKSFADLLRTRASDVMIRSVGSAVYPEMSQTLKDVYKPHPSGEPSILGISPTKPSCDYLASCFQIPPLRTVTGIGGSERSLNVANLRMGADLVIGTPGRIDWLLSTNSLTSGNIQLVLLDKSNQLLTSDIVLKILNQVPLSAQRVLVTGSSEPTNPWLQDTVHSIIRPVGLVDLVPTDPPESTRTKHTYSLVGQSEQLKQLRFTLDTSGSKKTIVFVRSLTDVEVLRENRMFNDLLFDTDNSNSVARFNAASRAILVTHDLSSIPTDCRIVHFGLPKSPDEYANRTSSVEESHVLLRKPEFDKFKSVYLKKNRMSFSALGVPSPTELTLSFFQNTVRQMKQEKSESSPLVKMHGSDLVTGLILMAEEGRIFGEKTSPLSGEPGYSPVLLVDPFMKKIKSHQVCHKIVSDCLRQSKKSIGRIALSEKGFVVDVPTDLVSTLTASPKLKRRNIHAVFLSQIPRIVDKQKTFIIKRTVRDRKLAARLIAKRKR